MRMEVADERRAGVSRKLWVWVGGEKWLGGAGQGWERVGPVRCSGVITFTSAHCPPPPLPRILHMEIQQSSLSPPPLLVAISVETLNLVRHILSVSCLWNA